MLQGLMTVVGESDLQFTCEICHVLSFLWFIIQEWPHLYQKICITWSRKLSLWGSIWRGIARFVYITRIYSKMECLSLWGFCCWYNYFIRKAMIILLNVCIKSGTLIGCYQIELLWMKTGGRFILEIIFWGPGRLFSRIVEVRFSEKITQNIRTWFMESSYRTLVRQYYVERFSGKRRG